MKTFNKILISLFVLSLTGFTACKDEVKYDPAEMPANAQVYFPNTLASKVELSQDLTVKSYDVELRRIDKSNALTVNLTVVNENTDIFTIPASVSFAANSDVTKITITYDPEELGFDDYKPIRIAVSDVSVTTPYGSSAYAFTAGIPAPWVSLGIATYTDDFVSALFGIPKVPYEVEIQENKVFPGLYRLVNPYGEDYPFNDPGDYDESQNYYLEINARDPEAVYIPHPQLTGTNWGYGNFIMSSVAGLNIANGSTLAEQKAAGNCGTLVDGVITFPIESLLFGMAGYKDGFLYTANENGWFQLAFPGVVLIDYDYSAEIEYKGRLTDPSGDDYAVAKVTLGPDVAYAKVAIAPGSMSNATLGGILDGSIESVEIQTGGTVKIPCTETGTYTYVVISFDAEDEPQEFDYETFDFFSSSGSGPEPTTIEDFCGDFDLVGKWIYDGKEYEMPVTIEKGDEPNTLIITGIDFAEEVVATFDPATGTMSIAPQEIEGFYDDYYDYTFPSGLFLSLDEDLDESETLILTFYKRLDGVIALTPSCEAIGYIIFGVDEEDDWYDSDGFFDFVFKPSDISPKKASSSVRTTMEKPKKIKKFGDVKASIVKEVKNSKSDFSIQPKFSLRKARFNKMDATPLQ